MGCAEIFKQCMGASKVVVRSASIRRLVESIIGLLKKFKNSGSGEDWKKGERSKGGGRGREGRERRRKGRRCERSEDEKRKRESGKGRRKKGNMKVKYEEGLLISIIEKGRAASFGYFLSIS